MRKSKFLYGLSGLILLIFGLAYIYGFYSLRVGEREFKIPGDKQIIIVEISAPETETIHLEKDDSGHWLINSEYSANDFAVSDLLRTVRHFAVRQPVSVEQKDLINKELEEEGVLINIYCKGYVFDFFNLFGLLETPRLYKSFFVGKNTEKVIGTYMRADKSENPYIVYLPGYEGGLSEVFTPKLYIWFDPVVIDVEAENIRTVQVMITDKPSESYKLVIDENFNFVFYNIKGEPVNANIIVDTTKVYRFLSSFKGLYYETLLTNDAYSESEKIISAQYDYEIIVEDRYDNYYAFKVYRRYSEEVGPENDSIIMEYDPDRFYLELKTGHRAVAQYYVFGRILRPLSFFKIK